MGARPAAFIVLVIAFVSISTAHARQWRPDPQSAANDYLIIQDQRGPREVVVVFWIAPQLIPDLPGAEAVREMLAKRLIIGIVHADVNELGQFTFRPVTAPAVTTGQGDVRMRIDRSQLEPTVVGGLTTVQEMMGNALGPMGRGIHWFVYDGTGIDSCGPGKFLVPHAGENYSYDTPIPGCR